MRSLRPRRMANASRMGNWARTVLLALVASACACSPSSAFIPVFRTSSDLACSRGGWESWMQDIKGDVLSRSSGCTSRARLPVPTRPGPSYLRSRREQTMQHLCSTWNQAPLPDDEQWNARASRSECLRPVVYSSLIGCISCIVGPVDPSFRALSGRLELPSDGICSIKILSLVTIASGSFG